MNSIPQLGSQLEDTQPAEENGIAFHHVGFVVASIEEAAAGFARSIGASWNGEIFSDPLQVVKVSFFEPVVNGLPTLELVEPVGTESTVYKFLQKGGGLHHLCYEVDSLERQLEIARSRGSLIARKPMPAVAFQQRRIAWVYTKHKLLLEYLER
jgi:methylmalonyl-CoA/ethylmalonyl-CoA epimerase